MQLDSTRLKALFAKTRESWVDYRNTSNSEGSIKKFKSDFAEIFPGASETDCEAALNSFLDGFYAESVLHYSEAMPIIARHEGAMELLGRDPCELSFYRERSRIFGIAKLLNAWFRDQLGPTFGCIASDEPHGWEKMPTKAKQDFRQGILNASPEKRAEFLADVCRLGVQFSARKNDSWRRVGINVLPWTLPINRDELLAEFQKPFTPTPEQACFILEYHCLVGDKYAVNTPTLDMNIAKKLAPHLPRGRADLERLIKYTRHQTSDAIKRLLIDTLRGTKRTLSDRLLRRAMPLDLPELWPEWIADKKKILLSAAVSRTPFGQAADRGSQSDWRALRGQTYDLDVVGYAKRIASAQSGGADISHALADLRELITVMRQNLTGLEARMSEQPEQLAWEQVIPLPTQADDLKMCPSLYGLAVPPTDLQLTHSEARTLQALDQLMARIELLQRHPALVPSDEELWLRTDETYVRYSNAFYQTQAPHSIFQDRTAPDGLLQRLDGLTFDMLDGPYVVDTEPGFAEVEFKSWRWSIWMLANLPIEIAIPRLDALANGMFRDGIERDPFESGRGRGHRQAELAGAVLTSASALPHDDCCDFFDRLIARVRAPALQQGLADVRASVKRNYHRQHKIR